MLFLDIQNEVRIISFENIKKYNKAIFELTKTKYFKK